MLDVVRSAISGGNHVNTRPITVFLELIAFSHPVTGLLLRSSASRPEVQSCRQREKLMTHTSHSKTPSHSTLQYKTKFRKRQFISQ